MKYQPTGRPPGRPRLADPKTHTLRVGVNDAELEALTRVQAATAAPSLAALLVTAALALTGDTAIPTQRNRPWTSQRRNGERLARARRRRGLSQQGLAAAAGVTSATISRYECGHNRPPQAVQQAITAVLGVRAWET